MMKHIAGDWPTWDGTPEHSKTIQDAMNYYEDGVISFKYGKPERGFKVANAAEACEFAQGGNRNQKFLRDRPFGFHRTWQKIDFKTGLVDSKDTGADICKNYDQYIEAIK